MNFYCVSCFKRFENDDIVRVRIHRNGTSVALLHVDCLFEFDHQFYNELESNLLMENLMNNKELFPDHQPPQK